MTAKDCDTSAPAQITQMRIEKNSLLDTFCAVLNNILLLVKNKMALTRTTLLVGVRHSLTIQIFCTPIHQWCADYPSKANS